jgi:hypothetical protein
MFVSKTQIVTLVYYKICYYFFGKKVKNFTQVQTFFIKALAAWHSGHRVIIRTEDPGFESRQVVSLFGSSYVHCSAVIIT